MVVDVLETEFRVNATRSRGLENIYIYIFSACDSGQVTPRCGAGPPLAGPVSNPIINHGGPLT